MNDQRYSYATASTRCAAAQPNRLIETSVASNWTSVLLDHHEGAGRSEIFETHPTEDLTLVVATTGRHQIEAFDGGRWRSAVYQPGSGGITPPGQTARLRWQTPQLDQAFRTLHLYIPGPLMEATADEYRRIGQPSSPMDLSALAVRDEVVTMHVRSVLDAYKRGEPDLYAAGAARWLATHLLSHHAQWRHVTDDRRLATSITDPRLARVIEFMSCHLDAPLTLDELAHEAGISVHHFGRKFRERTGMGPSAYLATLRIDRARMLLTTTDLPISEIAIHCGYPRASAFSTAFLRHVGTTPRDYRSNR